MSGGSGVEGGKGRIFAFFQNPHTNKEKVSFLKSEYGIGGHSHALSGAVGSNEDHDGKGLHFKKDGCPDVNFSWETVAKRITDLIQKGRYLTDKEQAAYEKIQAEKALAEEDAIQAQQPDPEIWEYNGVKERHPDDLVLYQMGDFFELYGEDAKIAAAELDLRLGSRAIPGGGRVEMCGFPANRMEQVVEQLRDKHDVTVCAVPEGGKERAGVSMPSIDHEAEQAIDAQEAEFGADGTRVFRDTETEPAKPTLGELHEQYKPIVIAAVLEMCHTAMPAVTATMRTPSLRETPLSAALSWGPATWNCFAFIPTYRNFASGCTGKSSTRPIHGSMSCCVLSHR